jgi:hypothetical protein
VNPHYAMTAMFVLVACAPPPSAVVPQTAPTTPTAPGTLTAPTAPAVRANASRPRLGPAQVVTTPPRCASPISAAASHYPTSYRLFSSTERAARAHELQQTGYWSFVDLDDYGFVRVARSQALGDVPPLRSNAPLPAGWRLDADEVAAWAQTLPCQPDAFGLQDTRPPTFTQNATDSFAVLQHVGPETAGRISLGLEVRTDFPTDPSVPRIGKNVWGLTLQGHFWPGATLPSATITTVAATARVIGATYDVTRQLGPPPCARNVPCPPTRPTTEVMQVTAPLVHARQAIIAVRHASNGPAELRRVIRVDVDGIGPAGTQVTATPRAGAPMLPYFVNAVTGEDLSAWPCGFAGDVCGQYFGT